MPRLPDLPADFKIGAGNENFRDDFGKPILRRLGCLAALRGIIPNPVEISSDIFD